MATESARPALPPGRGRRLENGGIGLLAAALVAVCLLVPTSQEGIVALVLIYWIGLVGTNIIFGYAGQFNLAQNALFAAGACAFGVLTTRDVPVAPAVLVAIGVAVLGGLLTALVAGRVRGMSLAVLTLGIALAVPDMMSASSLTGGFEGIVGIPSPSVGGNVLLGRELLLLFSAIALLVFVLSRNLLRSTWGTALKALARDAVAAEALGLPAFRYRMLAFAVGGGIVGLAGAMYASYQGYAGYLSFQVSLVLLWYLGLILGGAGSVWGPLVGAVVIAVVPNRLPVAVDWQPLLWGAALVVVLAVAPRGVNAGLARLLARLRRPAVPVDPLPPAPAPAPAPAAVATVPARPPSRRGGEGDPSGLDAQAVSLRIGDFRILSEVSLQVAPGEVHALLGANGAGKSTLVDIVTGYQSPTSGTVRFGQRDITGSPPAAINRLGLARTFQHARLFEQESVRENVLAGLHAQQRPGLVAATLGLPPARRAHQTQWATAGDVLDELGIAGHADTPVAELPMGLRQMVSLARALMTGPRVVLLDEPAAGLSGEEMHHLAALVQRLGERGLGVLVIDHRLDFVRAVAHRATCLEAGRPIATGAVDEVLAAPEVRIAFLGEAAGEPGGPRPRVVVDARIREERDDARR